MSSHQFSRRPECPRSGRWPGVAPGKSAGCDERDHCRGGVHRTDRREEGAVASFPPTSTIRAAPWSSRCERRCRGVPEGPPLTATCRTTVTGERRATSTLAAGTSVRTATAHPRGATPVHSPMVPGSRSASRCRRTSAYASCLPRQHILTLVAPARPKECCFTRSAMTETRSTRPSRCWWPAGSPDDGLVRLLELRPDLAQPAPGNVAALAARASSRQSVKAAADELDFLRPRSSMRVLVLQADHAGVPMDELLARPAGPGTRRRCEPRESRRRLRDHRALIQATSASGVRRSRRGVAVVPRPGGVPKATPDRRPTSARWDRRTPMSRVCDVLERLTVAHRRPAPATPFPAPRRSPGAGIAGGGSAAAGGR